MTALVFDCDGVLADTERYGHLPAFNQTFEEFGLPVRWSEEEYGRKLQIGGGKGRMASLLTGDFVREAGLPDDPEGQREAVAGWHKRKTAIYKAMVAQGRLPARPGITRIISEALDAGWQVAVASTSAEESVRAVVEHVTSPDQAKRIPVFAGDVVPAKKPDPGIYQLVVGELGLDRDQTLIDALVPAIDTLERELGAGTDAETAVRRTADAAREAAEATKDMVAHKGRAAYTGERSRGSVDAGATAVAVMLERISAAWAEGPAQEDAS